MPQYEYAIAAGWNVALSSLTNVEDFFRPYIADYSIKDLAPYSVSYNAHPQAQVMLDGSVRGDGIPVVEWRLGVLPYAAFEAFIDAYLTVSGEIVKSSKVTIYTRQRERDLYQRMNAWLIYPAFGEDWANRQYAAIDLVLRFNVVEKLPEPPPEP